MCFCYSTTANTVIFLCTTQSKVIKKLKISSYTFTNPDISLHYKVIKMKFIVRKHFIKTHWDLIASSYCTNIHIDEIAGNLLFRYVLEIMSSQRVVWSCPTLNTSWIATNSGLIQKSSIQIGNFINSFFSYPFLLIL